MASANPTGAERARIEVLEQGPRPAQGTGSQPVQSGTVALVAGVSPPIPARLTATSVIGVFLKTPVGDAGATPTVKYAALGADRNLGVQTFLAKALQAAGGGAVNVGDTSTVDWIVVG